MAECRSCKAPIEFISLNGKPHPLDPDPIYPHAAIGNRGTIDHAPTGDQLRALYGLIVRDPTHHRAPFVVSQDTTIGQLVDSTLWESHFKTCPDADYWREQ